MIVVKSLQKKYGAITALKDVSFEVKPGSIVGFVGPNGSGKSTTLRIVSGLESCDAGTCAVDGEPYSHVKNPWSKLGTLLDRQGINGELTGMRALQSVAAAYSVPDARVKFLMETVNLANAQNRKVKTFSLGMKQRLSLAIALIANPRYLILDEPMNGLDPDGILWLRNFLSSYRDEGGGILLSSHTLSEVETLGDSFVVIKSGVVVWSGSKVALDGSTGSIVSAENQEKLYEVLKRQQYEFFTEGNIVHVRNIKSSELGHLLYRAGIIITHLSSERNSLENLYLSLHEEVRNV